MAPVAQVFLWPNATLKPLGGYRPPSRMSRHPHSARTQSHSTHPNTPSQHRLRHQKVFPLSPSASRWGNFSRRILPSPQSLRPTAMRLPPRCNSHRGFIQFSHPHSGPLLPPCRTTTTLPVWTNALLDCPAQVGRPTMPTACSFRHVPGQSLLPSGPNCGPSSRSAVTRSAPNTRPSQARPQMTSTHTRENRIQSNSAWSILV